MIYHYLEWIDPDADALVGQVMDLDFEGADEIPIEVTLDTGRQCPIVLDHLFSPEIQKSLQEILDESIKPKKRVEIVREMESEFYRQGYDLLQHNHRQAIARLLRMKDNDYSPPRPDVLRCADEKDLGRLIVCKVKDTRFLIEYSLQCGMAEYLRQISENPSLN